MKPRESNPEQRFIARVAFSDEPDGCWEWRGALRHGYGRIRANGKENLVHRYAYELIVGPIPDGLVIDHLCCNTKCVNPAHMEPVTRRINTLRGTAPPAVAARKSHCLRGHPLSGSNARINDRGHRACRECDRLHHEAARLGQSIDECVLDQMALERRAAA